MTSPLFKPLKIKSLNLPNRIVMAPMTRSKSPGGIPGEDVADYYARRAAGNVSSRRSMPIRASSPRSSGTRA